MSRIAILGSGAWGTALALSLARQHKHTLTMWAHSPSHAEAMLVHRENTKYLPGFALPPDIGITPDLGQAIDGTDTLLCVTPSEFVGATAEAIRGLIRPGQIFISASKGIEAKSTRRMSEVVEDLLPVRFATLGGPSFAREVAEALPTAVVLATRHPEVATHLQRDFSSESLRVYTNEDVTGVEIGGALKNVIALAAGVVHGLALGLNASAALITRGMAEITRLAVACGAKPDTMAGLAGYGDLVLTCTGSLSRNRTVGVELGKGRALADILSGLNGKVAEGVGCTGAALGLARRHGVEMPITAEMYAILHNGREPRDAIRALMTRPGRVE